MKSFVAALILLLAGSAAVLHWTDQRREHYEAQAKARESLLQDSLARTILRVDANSVEVVRRVTVTRTLRDTLLLRLTDTMAVKEYIYQTDTLRLSCLACVASAARLKVYSDSSIQFWKQRYESVRPTWKQRFGISCGYSVVKVGADVKTGPSCGFTARVWP